MMEIAVLFALVAAVVASPLPRFNSLSPTGRIVGGIDAAIQEIPYQVSLQAFGSHICGASIISDTWILTAAHCMVYATSSYTVRAGSTVSNNGGVVVSLSSVTNHERYRTSLMGVPRNDISVLKLSSPLTLDSTRAVIPLFEQEEEATPGSVSVITGWGTTSQGGIASVVLQTVDVPIVSKAECNRAYLLMGGVPDGQICAAVPEGGKDACQGDSGGPLAIDGRLAGVVSWGNGCARRGWPGVYTEVASYRSWINGKTGV